MGNSSSSGRGHQDDTVDFGALTPQGIYTGPRDWNQQVVAQAIVDRKLAPFYRPLEDYEDGWDDEKILAHRKEPSAEEGAEGGSSRPDSVYSSSSKHHKRAGSSKQQQDQNRLSEAALYRGAAECPICFLYYPPNINHSRCCGQAICTECFVQIKRAEPTATHLESEPAACPYCVRPEFGVVYTPPVWRTGIGSDGALPPSPGANAQPNPKIMRQRRKSFGPNDPDVITTDHIRPDWQAKLDAVRAAVQRRANRRIIMRQVGDRLIPVGISSGRVQILPTNDDGQGGDGEGSGSGTPTGNSRRSRRRERELNRLLGMIGGNTGNFPSGVMGAQDLEELMIAEAMRLSLADEEDRQRKEREEEAKKGKKKSTEPEANGSGAGPSTGPGTTGNASSSSTPVLLQSGKDTDTSSPRTSTSTPPASLELPAVTGSSLLPPPADGRGRAPHRPSSSVSSVPPTPTLDNEGSARARSQPPTSSIGAAMRSAVSAVTAVAAPVPGTAIPLAADSRRAASVTPPSSAPVQKAVSPERSATPKPSTLPPVPPSVPPKDLAARRSPTPTPPSVNIPEAPAISYTKPVPALPEDPAPGSSALPALAPVIPLTIPSPTLLSPDGSSPAASAPRPIAQHAQSFASSIFSDDSEAGDPSAYDVLASSPESEDDEPLLQAEAPVARRTETGLSQL